MRTLKKALSLVLCVAMVLSLCVFSVSAKSITDYNDSKDIKYTEAAEVLSALGVINGKDNGNYDPKGELTRAEAAVIICRLLNVNPAGKSTFTDIRDPFYDPYIGYLQNQGFVNGYGDGRFGPDDKLTGSAFAKMLLVALGYEAETENMTGPQWEIGIAKLTKSTNITGGIVPFNPSEVVTREVAAQMSLNALKADMVEYPNGGVEVKTTDGTEVRVNRGNANQKTSSNDRYTHIKNDNRGNAATPEYVCQLGEDAWESLRLNDNGETDGLGRPTNKWEYLGNAITDAPKTPVASFYQGTTESNINDALKSYKICREVRDNDGIMTGEIKAENINSSTTLNHYDRLWCFEDNMTYAENNNARLYVSSDGINVALDAEGKHTTGYVENIPTIYSYKYTERAGGDTIAKRLANYLAKDQEGKLVEFYANKDNYITNIVVIEFKVAEVTNVTTASNGDITYTIKGRTMKDYADPSIKDTISVAGTLNRGDYVTIVKAGTTGDSVNYVYPTEKITGVQTSKDSTSKLTVDGNTLTVGRGVKDIDGNYIGWNPNGDSEFKVGERWKNSSNSRNFYKDQFGYIVHADEGNTAVTDYCVVSKISYGSASGLDSLNVKAVIVKTDGKSETVTIDKINGIEVKTANMDSTYDSTNSSSLNYALGIVGGKIQMNKEPTCNDVYQNKLVAYTVKSNGHYELKYGTDSNDSTDFGAPGGGETAGKIHTMYCTWSNAGAEVTTKNSAQVRGDRTTINANDSTVYIVRGKNENDYNVYTGFRSIPTIKAYSRANISYLQDGRIKLVYIDARGNKITTSSKDIFFGITDSVIEDNSGNNRVYKIDGILNGEKVTLTTESSSEFGYIKKGYLYSIDFTGNNLVDRVQKLNSSKGIITDKHENHESNYETYDLPRADEAILSASGIATSDSIKDINGGTFFGFSWNDSTKIVVVDDGKLVEGGNMTSISEGDAYYIQTVGNSGSDRTTIKAIYIDKGISKSLGAEPNSLNINDQVRLNDNVTVSDKALVEVNRQVYVPANKTLILNQGIDLGSFTRDTDGTTDSNYASFAMVVNGIVEINGALSDYELDPASVLVSGENARMIINIPDNEHSTLYTSFMVMNGAVVQINYPNKTVTLDDGATMSISSGSNVIMNASFDVDGTVSAVGAYTVDGDTALAVNGDLLVDGTLTAVNTYAGSPAVIVDGDIYNRGVINARSAVTGATPNNIIYAAILLSGRVVGNDIQGGFYIANSTQLSEYYDLVWWLLYFS